VVEIKIEGGQNMMLRAVSPTAALLASVSLGASLVASPAAAQTPQPPPADSPAAVPAPGKPAGMLEGSVKKVDPAAGMLQVSSGPLGMFGRTLEVDSNTQIQVEGREGTLADLQEGAKVKASYEARDGKNIATRIEVMPAQ
jgi:Cu/Ag efflux protein CusF